MKNTFHLTAILCLLASVLGQTYTSHAQGTAFTYQGRLNNGSALANGNYDLRFALYDAASAGLQQGNLLTNTATVVSNGLFTVMLDFGDQFPGAGRWLELGVRTNGGGAFDALVPRQALTTTPYALRAANAATAATASSVAAANITGMIPAAQLPANLITNGASGVSFSGAFSGNGVGITNLGINALNSLGLFASASLTLSQTLPSYGSYSVIAADVNMDGKIDLISGDYPENKLWVFLNTGSGNFALASSPSVGVGPVSITAADVNGDGKVDLISANAGDNTLSILLNNGSGGFALASSPGVGNSPRSVTSADVNGDGKVDLISVDYSGPGKLTVLTNNGSGGFVLATSPGVGLYPVSVTAADVNGDGKVDLISANANSSTLSVLTNTGSGNFVLACTLSPGFNTGPGSVIAADVNGDGQMDLINANANLNSLSIFTNTGSGSFTLAASPGVGSTPYSVTSADVNGDGKVDLISANYGANTLTILTNNGSGVFALASLPSVGVGPHGVASADVNGDGKADLISADFYGYTLTVLVNKMVYTGTFTGDGSGFTLLNATNLIGKVADSALSVSVSLLGQSIESAEITDGTIVNADINAAAAIADTKLATISTAGKVADSALSANIARLNTPQTFTSTNSFAGITSPKWKVSQLLTNTPGGLPKSNISFTCGGGTLVITAAGSGYTASSGLIGMDIKLDSTNTIGACQFMANQSFIHYAFVPNTIVQTGIAAGSHTLSLTAKSGTITDNDYFTLTVMELPF